VHEWASIDLDAVRLGHGVRFDFHFSTADRPWIVVDLASFDLAVGVDGEQAIAFGEKVFDGVFLIQTRLADGAVDRAELRGR